ncbi:AMP-binding protein, partial [Streptomyces anulatus]
VLDLPTAFWHELVAAGGRLPGSVHTVIIGGEGALPSRVAQWARLAPGIRLINTYGPTEATVVATAADLHPSASGRP